MGQEHYILFRFMSFDEAIKLLKGEQLHNDKDFKKNGVHTESKGFCFMDGDKEDAEYSYEYLSGIVSDDVCLILRYNHNKPLTESSGKYADPCGHFFDTITEDEVCIEDYDIDVMTPIRYGFVTDFDNFEWHDMLGEHEDTIKVFEQRKAEKEEAERKEREEKERKESEEEDARCREHNRCMDFYKALCASDLIENVSYNIDAQNPYFVKREYNIEFKTLLGFNLEIHFCTYEEILETAKVAIARSMIPTEKKEHMFEILKRILNNNPQNHTERSV